MKTIVCRAMRYTIWEYSQPPVDETMVYVFTTGETC